jgi:glycosyltransferase involved in cell wall biosynthesis
MMFTIFTPVYNRRTSLPRVWESLRAQTFRDFEWIVVDDGSQDGVGELLEEYLAMADFPMRVFIQENRGKHVAWNRAVAEAKGELFVPLDSDDACIPATLEKFAALWENIMPLERDRFSGINVLCRDADTGDIVGNPYPFSPMISNNLELLYVHGVVGEKWGCIRTDILRSCLFPETRGYFAESYIWFDIARRFSVLCVNEALRIYYHDQTNKLTGRLVWGSRISMPAKYEFLSWHIRTNIDFLKKNKLLMLKDLINVWRLGFNTGRSIGTIFRDINTGNSFYILCMLPAGALVMLRDRVVWRFCRSRY